MNTIRQNPRGIFETLGDEPEFDYSATLADVPFDESKVEQLASRAALKPSKGLKFAATRSAFARLGQEAIGDQNEN
jgi:hypothetical protein